MNNTLYIVVPCYNEEEVLPLSAKIFRDKLQLLMDSGKVSAESKIAFVDDGSTDATWAMIEALHEKDSAFLGIKLSRNRGHQNALLAGLATVVDDCDMTISIDADVQDDVNAMDAMVDAFMQGNEIVYGVRKSRDTDTFLKRFTAQSFYKLMHSLGVEAVYNHADYRLLSKRAVKALLEFKEVNLFLRGMVPLMGFKSTEVHYDRAQRLAGQSKYSVKKMLSLAFDGITSFTVEPIRLIGGLGMLLFVIGLILAVVFIVKAFLHTSAGWMWTLLAVWLFGSLQLMAIGVVGEYIGKIYLETKGRPRFIVETYLK